MKPGVASADGSIVSIDPGEGAAAPGGGSVEAGGCVEAAGTDGLEDGSADGLEDAGRPDRVEAVDGCTLDGSTGPQDASVPRRSAPTTATLTATARPMAALARCPGSMRYPSVFIRPIPPPTL